MDNNSLDPKMIAKIATELLSWIADKKPFGIVHDTAPINYGGEIGLLVWDYVIWNELTFLDHATKSKQSLFNSISDKETKKKFDEIVARYGI